MKFGPGKRAALTAAVIAFGLVAAACAADDTTVVDDSAAATGQTTGAEPTADDTPEDTSESAVGPAVVLPTVSGGQIDFGSLEGVDTILWYWAPW